MVDFIYLFKNKLVFYPTPKSEIPCRYYKPGDIPNAAGQVPGQTPPAKQGRASEAPDHTPGYADLSPFSNWFAYNRYLCIEDTPDDFSKTNYCLKSMQM